MDHMRGWEWRGAYFLGPGWGSRQSGVSCHRDIGLRSPLTTGNECGCLASSMSLSPRPAGRIDLDAQRTLASGSRMVRWVSVVTSGVRTMGNWCLEGILGRMGIG